MIPGSDTAKQDLILVIAGAVGALIFYSLYSDLHPLSTANPALGEYSADSRSIQVVSDLGYDPLEGPVSTYRGNSTLLDSLQLHDHFREFYSNPLHRSLYPVFYWNSIFKIGEAEPDTGFDMFENRSRLLAVQLSEDGELLSLNNQTNALPAVQVFPDVLQAGFELDQFPAFAIDDSSLAARFQFQFTGQPQEFDSTRIAQGNIQYTPRSVAERMAEYYVENSAWPHRHFNVTSSSVRSIDNTNAAEVTFTYSGDISTQQTELTVVVLPAGGLLSMQYNFRSIYSGNAGIEEIKSGLRGVFILLGVFWLIILLFIRFRMRLIDIKLATLVAVIAGLFFPLLAILAMVHSHIHHFGSLDFRFIFSVLVSTGLFAAISSLGFFAVTATSDSITRQYWQEKLRTIDLMRVGQAFSIPVGVNIVRGIPYGFIIAMVWMVTILLLPSAYISVENTLFQANSTYLPYLSEILGNLIIYLLVAQAFFLIVLGYVRSISRNKLLLGAVVTALFVLMNPYPFSVGGLQTELITTAVTGILFAIIYFREDFLTTFISLFVFVTTVNTAPGWVMPQSPDFFTFLVFLIIIGIAFITGALCISKGKSASELPDFVPSYVLELAQEDRMKQELQIARKVQESFLPVRTPDVEGLDIAAICKPAYETGGDYYDLIPLENGSLAVTIGDVSGKGIQAAFYMTFIKGVLHSLCNDYRSTIEVLTKTNKLFRRNANRSTFISLIFGVVNVENNLFSFSRAGHNPLLYFENKTGTLHEFKPEGLAIGMADEEIFKRYIGEQNIKFEKGDLLILFTDGVVEAISKTNKVYGDRRLHSLVKKYNKLPAIEIINKMEKDLSRFSENTPQHDDLTMIVIKKK